MRSRKGLAGFGGTALVAAFALRALMAAGAEPGTPATDAADHSPTPVGDIIGVPQIGGMGRTDTVSSIMERENNAPRLPVSFEFDAEEPRLRPFTPGDDAAAPAVSQWPPLGLESLAAQEPQLPQIQGISFKAVGTVGGESPYIPPDTMGDVGPSQILVHVNGRIRLFGKDGTPGTLNASDTTFWDPVRAGQGTTDPEVRYDRLSGRWFVLSVNVAATNNLVMIAVSSDSVITDASSFTFYAFPIGIGGSGEDTNFCDYPGFGVDANALYVGCNMFNGAGTFQHTTGYVIRKSSVLSGGPIVLTPFANLTGGVAAGPFAPRGVDNDDPQAAEGYFIGVDIALFSRVVLRRVSSPGGTPTLSGNLNLTVPTTSSPLLQVASGSTTSLDPSDDRLYMASIHKNKISGASTLWTAQNIAVNTSCVGAGSGSGRRNAARWYEITGLTSTPALAQSGSLCDTAATNPRGYIYPTVIGTGQGHMALGATFAAANTFAGAVASGRLRTDTLGSTQAATVLQNGLAAYNLVAQGRNRWGDYSFTDVDPNDDQTVWTLQEYADSPASNWAVRVVQLRAPLPATPASATPTSVCPGLTSATVTITGTASSGSGFFDPGPDTGGPGYASHIAAAVSDGVTVNGITFTDPTHVVLDVNTTAAPTGPKNVTITNPDGQSTTGSGILTINGSSPPIASNSGPACEGATLQLLASTIPGAVYAWSGPNGFASGSQNPVISNVGAAAGGTYSVTATVGGCTTLAGTTTVTVIGDGGSCDDANACTLGEICNAGICGGGAPVTPLEVNDTLSLSDDGSQTTISWIDPPADYSVYRGTRTDGTPWSYNQQCLSPRIGTSSATDPDVPPVGSMFFYLVTRVDACGESIPGRDSGGTPNPNDNPCP